MPLGRWYLKLLETIFLPDATNAELMVSPSLAQTTLPSKRKLISFPDLSTS
jgi:hypothetical protein